MSFSQTNKALIEMYQSLALGLSTAYEGVAFNPPSQGDWAAVFIRPVTNQPATNGRGGQDEESGFLQIDFYTPQGKSVSKFYGWADSVQQNIIVGQGYIYSGHIVHVQSVERTGIDLDGAWLKMTVTINWFSRFTRPDF